jgi:cytosine/adenosine deaminase-related metal-dependent hydrolase
MRANNRLIISIVLCLSCSTIGYGRPPLGADDTVVFSHVNVVSMKTTKVFADQTVVVRRSKIIKIDRSENNPRRGMCCRRRLWQYLMPGLADLHVHLFPPDDLLSYGVWSDHGPEHERRAPDLRWP